MFKRFFLTLAVTVVCASCAAAQTDYINSLTEKSPEARIVCSHASLFEGYTKLDSETCLKGIESLTRKEKKAFYNAAFCVLKHRDDRTKLETCLTRIDWSAVAAALLERIPK